MWISLKNIARNWLTNFLESRGLYRKDSNGRIDKIDIDDIRIGSSRRLLSEYLSSLITISDESIGSDSGWAWRTWSDGLTEAEYKEHFNRVCVGNGNSYDSKYYTNTQSPLSFPEKNDCPILLTLGQSSLALDWGNRSNAALSNCLLNIGCCTTFSLVNNPKILGDVHIIAERKYIDYDAKADIIISTWKKNEVDSINGK